MTMQEAEANYFAMMGEPCCAEPPELGDIDRGIEDCMAMLDYAIGLADRNEIKFWRRMLQTAKVQRRELLAT